ncbi:MAG: hypothetical protein R3E63_09215 [Pseudomonadales bacterium]
MIADAQDEVESRHGVLKIIAIFWRFADKKVLLLIVVLFSGKSMIACAVILFCAAGFAHPTPTFLLHG